MKLYGLDVGWVVGRGESGIGDELKVLWCILSK